MDQGAWRATVHRVGKSWTQIHYDYTVEVRNRFKGLDLMGRVHDELWMEVHDTTGDRNQDHPQEKEMQKIKMAV